MSTRNVFVNQNPNFIVYEWKSVGCTKNVEWALKSLFPEYRETENFRIRFWTHVLREENWTLTTVVEVYKDLNHKHG